MLAPLKIAMAVLVLGSAPAFGQSVLKIGSSADIQIIDPVFTTAHPTRDHGYLIYDTLFGVDAQLQPKPQMLDSWTIAPDGRSITFKLRPGLKFHDGNAVTSADVIASIERWSKLDSMAKVAIKSVKEIKAAGADGFVMLLSEPSTLIIDAMAKPSGQVLFIMPARIAATPPSEQVKDPIGSGPFTFSRAEWVPGQRRIYRRFADYVPRTDKQENTSGAKVAKVDVIEYVIMPDDQTRQAAMLKGEIDYASTIAPDLLEPLKKSNALVNEVRDTRGEQGWMRLNHTQPPFDNVKARQAVYLAVSQEEYMGMGMPDRSHWEICYAMFGCGTEYASEVGADGLKQRNLERARQLVKESGYDGRTVVLLDPTNHPQLHAWNLKTAENLRSIGFTVQLQGIALATMAQRRIIKKPVAEGGWNIFHTTFATVDVLNPTINPAVNASCAGDNWPGWPCNEEIEKLRRDFVAASDSTAKKRITGEIQKLAYAHGTHVPLGVFYKVDTWSKRLSGVEKASVGVFWGIAKN